MHSQVGGVLRGQFLCSGLMLDYWEQLGQINDHSQVVCIMYAACRSSCLLKKSPCLEDSTPPLPPSLSRDVMMCRRKMEGVGKGVAG
jgi:hypothetical protein